MPTLATIPLLRRELFDRCYIIHLQNFKTGHQWFVIMASVDKKLGWWPDNLRVKPSGPEIKTNTPKLSSAPVETGKSGQIPRSHADLLRWRFQKPANEGKCAKISVRD